MKHAVFCIHIRVLVSFFSYIGANIGWNNSPFRCFFEGFSIIIAFLVTEKFYWAKNGVELQKNPQYNNVERR